MQTQNVHLEKSVPATWPGERSGKNEPPHEDTGHPHWGGRGVNDGMEGQQSWKNPGVTQDAYMLPSAHIDTPRPDTSSPLSSPYAKDRNTPSRHMTTVAILGDSNTAQLDPLKMTQKVSINLHPCYTSDQALLAVKQGHSADITVLHTGTNDLKYKTPEEIVGTIAKTAKIICSQYKKVIISKLLPREGLQINQDVSHTNYLLEREFKNYRDIYIVDSEGYSLHGRPREDLYRQQYRDGRKVPLLHLNKQGLIILSKEIQKGIRSLNRPMQ